MEFKVTVRELKEMLKRTGNKNEHIETAVRYKDEKTRTTIPLDQFTAKELKTLYEIVGDRIKSAPEDRDAKWLRNRLTAYFELNNSAVTDKTIVKNVEQLTIALKKFIGEYAPHRWIFTDDTDRITMPYFVDEIKYTKRKRTRYGVEPAFVRLEMHAHKHGSRVSQTSSWSEDNYRPMSVSEALSTNGLSLETEVAVSAYRDHLDAYTALQSVCGRQMYAIGEGFAAGDSRWSRWGTTPMVRNGVATKVVLDQGTEEIDSNKGDDEPVTYTTTFWSEVPDGNGISGKGKIDEDEENYENEGKKGVDVALPVHTYLYVFDLDKHQWVDLHVSNLQDYPWDKNLVSKLILPKAQKDLLEILMSTTEHNVGDIIRGKMNGIIVLATGVPGIGKTLTAEVFSEYIEKPLYTVQCSQLGLDVDSIEKNLEEVLSRASRWGAVLLIDEADVYIRKRSEDIVQNAIVGVFLRLLEYYRGVLFMTSNRGEIIDDAILSRATAWVKYDLPDEQLLEKIWEVLAAQYSVKIDERDIARLISRLPKLSGRSVRNILKLGTLLKGSKVTVNDLLNVSQYQALENN